LIDATFCGVSILKTLKEKVMNDEILIELGDVSEATKGPGGQELESNEIFKED
jgi:hypothetical protein